MDRKEIIISTGTLAHLTGRTKYDELEVIENNFYLWLETCEDYFDNWMEAWKIFWYTARKNRR